MHEKFVRETRSKNSHEKLARNRTCSIWCEKLAREISCCKSVWHTYQFLARVNSHEFLVHLSWASELPDLGRVEHISATKLTKVSPCKIPHCDVSSVNLAAETKCWQYGQRANYRASWCSKCSTTCDIRLLFKSCQNAAIHVHTIHINKNKRR